MFKNNLPRKYNSRTTSTTLLIPLKHLHISIITTNHMPRVLSLLLVYIISRCSILHLWVS